jgi:protein phosphatase
MSAFEGGFVSLSLTLEAAARTEVGRCRTVNQDVTALRSDLRLFILADGMGGHPAGEVASAIAVEAMQQFYRDAGATWPPDADGPASDPRAFLVAAAKHANRRIRVSAELNPEHRGMGAAMAAIHVGSSGFCLAHVGHVRAYRFRDGGIELLCHEHTVLNRRVAEGATPEDAQQMPDANRLDRALGLRARVEVTTRVEDTRPGDVVALVSNGLYNSVRNLSMARLVAGRASLGAMVDDLIHLAVAHDAADDVSCILLRWAGGREEQPPRAA